MAKNKAFDLDFKKGVIQYCLEHPDETYTSIGKQFSVHPTTVSGWVKEYKEKGNVEVRGSGNYASDDAKEIARLKRELKNTKDALEVLKKAISILGK